MASDLRKGLVLGNAGMLNRASVYSFDNQRAQLAGTNTKWVRFWADWSELQPNPSSSFDNNLWAPLDGQIRDAIAAGYYVIVTAYRYPLWTNQARRGPLCLASAEAEKFVVPDQIGTYYPGTTTRTPWSLFIEHLTIRYNPANPGNQGAWAHCVEILNEPNVQMQPLWENQCDPAAAGWKPQIQRFVAEMMRTAQNVKNGIGGAKDFWPILLAPATGDTEKKSTIRMPYDIFTSALIAELSSFRPGGWFGWSHHNHRDIEVDGGSGSDFYSGPQINRAQHARSIISGKWYGWDTANPNDPKIFLTEGGGRLNVIKDEWFDKKNRAWSPSLVRDKQAQLLQRQISRMSTSTEGAGMSMMMQYLATSAFTYDTGLRDAYVYENEAGIV